MSEGLILPERKKWYTLIRQYKSSFLFLSNVISFPNNLKAKRNVRVTELFRTIFIKSSEFLLWRSHPFNWYKNISPTAKNNSFYCTKTVFASNCALIAFVRRFCFTASHNSKRAFLRWKVYTKQKSRSLFSLESVPRK